MPKNKEARVRDRFFKRIEYIEHCVWIETDDCKYST